MGDENGIDLLLCVGRQSLAYFLGIGRGAPLEVEWLDVRAEGFGDAGKPVAEDADAHREHRVSRGKHVDDGRLEAAGARTGENEHIVLGLEDLLEAFCTGRQGRRELGSAMVDHFPGPGEQNGLGDWGRAGNHQ